MEINLDKLFEIKSGKPKYKEISKFPETKKDIALVVDKDIEAETIKKVIKKAGGNKLKAIDIFDVYEGAIIDNDKKSIAFSLTFGEQDRTLTDEEVNLIMEKIVDATSKEFGSYLRS